MEKASQRAPNGRLYTGSLFYEKWRDCAKRLRRCDPQFSLYSDVEFKGKKLINCKKTFIEEADPTGYKWAIKYLDSYQHWLRLCGYAWFKEALATWREELAAKLHAEAVGEIIELSRTAEKDAQRLQAAKYVAERGWEKGNKRPVGRPKMDDAPVRNTGAPSEEADAARIGLRLVTNNGE